jgi:hypothetical protein
MALSAPSAGRGAALVALVALALAAAAGAQAQLEAPAAVVLAVVDDAVVTIDPETVLVVRAPAGPNTTNCIRYGADTADAAAAAALELSACAKLVTAYVAREPRVRVALRVNALLDALPHGAVSVDNGGAVGAVAAPRLEGAFTVFELTVALGEANKLTTVRVEDDALQPALGGRPSAASNALAILHDTAPPVPVVRLLGTGPSTSEPAPTWQIDFGERVLVEDPAALFRVAFSPPEQSFSVMNTIADVAYGRVYIVASFARADLSARVTIWVPANVTRDLAGLPNESSAGGGGAVAGAAGTAFAGAAAATAADAAAAINATVGGARAPRRLLAEPAGVVSAGELAVNYAPVNAGAASFNAGLRKAVIGLSPVLALGAMAGFVPGSALVCVVGHIQNVGLTGGLQMNFPGQYLSASSALASTVSPGNIQIPGVPTAEQKAVREAAEKRGGSGARADEALAGGEVALAALADGAGALPPGVSVVVMRSLGAPAVVAEGAEVLAALGADAALGDPPASPEAAAVAAEAAAIAAAAEGLPLPDAAAAAAAAEALAVPDAAAAQALDAAAAGDDYVAAEDAAAAAGDDYAQEQGAGADYEQDAAGADYEEGADAGGDGGGDYADQGAGDAADGGDPGADEVRAARGAKASDPRRELAGLLGLPRIRINRSPPLPARPQEPAVEEPADGETEDPVDGETDLPVDDEADAPVDGEGDAPVDGDPAAEDGAGGDADGEPAPDEGAGAGAGGTEGGGAPEPDAGAGAPEPDAGAGAGGDADGGDAGNGGGGDGGDE